MGILFFTVVCGVQHESLAFNGALKLTDKLNLFPAMVSHKLRLVDVESCKSWNLFISGCLRHARPFSEGSFDRLIVDPFRLLEVHDRAEIAVFEGRATVSTRA